MSSPLSRSPMRFRLVSRRLRGVLPRTCRLIEVGPERTAPSPKSFRRSISTEIRQDPEDFGAFRGRTTTPNKGQVSRMSKNFCRPT